MCEGSEDDKLEILREFEAVLKMSSVQSAMSTQTSGGGVTSSSENIFEITTQVVVSRDQYCNSFFVVRDSSIRNYLNILMQHFRLNLSEFAAVKLAQILTASTDQRQNDFQNFLPIPT